MTLSAQKSGDLVKIGFHGGSVESFCTEYLGHVRSFWHSLGALLDHMENEAAK